MQEVDYHQRDDVSLRLQLWLTSATVAIATDFCSLRTGPARSVLMGGPVAGFEQRQKSGPVVTVAVKPPISHPSEKYRQK